MLNYKLRKTKKIISFLIILCMVAALPMVSRPVFAEGEEGEPVDDSIKVSGDLKTSHKFPEVKYDSFGITVRDEETDEESTIYCEVSFIPSIEEGEMPIPFFTAKVLGSESILTIRENNIYERAEIDIESVKIEYPEGYSALVEAGEPSITVSEEYYSGTDIFYDIIFEVDFYSKAKPEDEKVTLRYPVRVYDSPLLGVEVNYRDNTTTHYGNDAAYITNDIFNSTVNVNTVRESGEDHPDKRAEPVEGVPTNIFYYWGASDNQYCTFKPTDVWKPTGANGTATFVIGDGTNTIMSDDIGLPAEALYGMLDKGVDDSLSQYYTYPDLKDFEGILEVTVVNTFGEPLKDRNVQIWGGVKYDHKQGNNTNEQGIATIRYPAETTSTAIKKLTMTELPTFELEWNVTQVIDNPSRIVEGHNAPLYLSPEVSVTKDYSSLPHMDVRGVKLQVYDTADPERVLIETPAMAFQEEYTDRAISIFGSHRAYIKISPTDWAEKKLGIRAVVANKDEGAREKYQVRGYVEDKTSPRELYVPKKTFTFAFVPLRVGTEENNSSLSFSGLGPQKEYIRKIFPAPVQFVEKSAMFIAKPRFSTHGMYLSRIFRQLDREQKRFPNKYDLIIGMTPKGFLGATGLQESGYYGMNWDFLGAAKGAVLIDPSQVLPHTTLHEFLHTLDFSDVYPEEDNQQPSANGHDGTPINHVPGQRPSSQAILYDVASNPWPTEGEYNALLEYATKPKSSGSKSLLRMNTFSLTSQEEVLLLSGTIEDARSNQRKVDFDTIIEYSGDSDASYSPSGDDDYVIQTLDSGGNVLSTYFFSDYAYEGKYYAKFIANLPAENVQAIEIGKWEYGEISQLFQRYEYSSNPPVVSLTGPTADSLSGDFTISWTASDGDGDTLRSEVRVSSDDGSTWDTIARDIPDRAGGEYSYAVDAETFPKGDYSFKVVVTDGMHFAEEVSDTYTIQGYDPKPDLYLPESEVSLEVKGGTQEATAYFVVGNKGKKELDVVFSTNTEAAGFVSPLFVKEYTIYSGQNQVIAIPLVLPGNAEGTLEEIISLETNDPDNRTANLTIKVSYIGEEETLIPELAYLLTRPADLSNIVSGSALAVTFDAFAEAGQRGLDATLIIEDKDGNEILEEDPEAQTGRMVENNHKPGIYTYHWEREEGLPAGDYGVYIDLEDTQVSPSALRVRAAGEYDLEFTINEPNEAPEFITPTAYENDLGVVKSGDTVTIPYEVTDPDGDDLTIEVFSNLEEYGLKLTPETNTSGKIEWTANFSGAHSIYLTAEDPSGNRAEVVYNIVEDNDLFTINLETNPTEGGRALGGGFYASGAAVTVEAVAAESFEFVNWTEDGDVVSTDEKYTFVATEDRDLVANFAEEPIFRYSDPVDGKVEITGFNGADKFTEDIVIPDEIGGYSVTGIGDMAFWSKGIESVSFPETLTSIGRNAFHSNQLTQVILPNSVDTIGDYAFGFNSALAEVVILNSNPVIGTGAFAGASSLVIYGVPGSTAETYATTSGSGITFKDIRDYKGTLPTVKYTITIDTVVGGTADVTIDKENAAAGDTITVTIANIESGKRFKSITVTDGDSGTVSTTTVTAGSVYTFTIPAQAVTITVEVEDDSVIAPEKYTVTMEGTGTGATGTGEYAENDAVNINAGTRSDYTFNGWTSDDVNFANASAASTTFTMPAKAVIITATWKAVSSSGGGSGSSGGGGGGTTGPLTQDENNMGRETTEGTTTTTIVDQAKLETHLETAEKGSGILIPLSENKTSSVQLPLDSFDSMAEKEVTLTVLSGPVSIDIPASSIDTGAIRDLLGKDADGGDIIISVTIAQPSAAEAASLQAAADSERLGTLGTPIVFSITASVNGKTVEVASFSQYVQRRIEVDPDTAEKVTTALVFEEDNTFRPVPTSVYFEGGKHYVVVTTRTNSTYVLVSQNTFFSDTEGKWYQDIVKEMADRRIISGMGDNTFAGDREITRAEFATIMIRALGLPAKGTLEFSDVSEDSWYHQAVGAAARYGIVSGKGNKKFDPLAKITREEAMQIIFNASKLTPLEVVKGSVDQKAYSDYNAKSQWAREAVDFNLNNGLIVGSNGKINPKANITRGEAATVILKLLQEANLVDTRAEF